jgi:hypothetical protein
MATVDVSNGVVKAASTRATKDRTTVGGTLGHDTRLVVALNNLGTRNIGDLHDGITGAIRSGVRGDDVDSIAEPTSEAANGSGEGFSVHGVKRVRPGEQGDGVTSIPLFSSFRGKGRQNTSEESSEGSVNVAVDGRSSRSNLKFENSALHTFDGGPRSSVLVVRYLGTEPRKLDTTVFHDPVGNVNTGFSSVTESKSGTRAGNLEIGEGAVIVRQVVGANRLSISVVTLRSVFLGAEANHVPRVGGGVRTNNNVTINKTTIFEHEVVNLTSSPTVDVDVNTRNDFVHELVSSFEPEHIFNFFVGKTEASLSRGESLVVGKSVSHPGITALTGWGQSDGFNTSFVTLVSFSS